MIAYGLKAPVHTYLDILEEINFLCICDLSSTFKQCFGSLKIGLLKTSSSLKIFNNDVSVLICQQGKQGCYLGTSKMCAFISVFDVRLLGFTVFPCVDVDEIVLKTKVENPCIKTYLCT